MLCEYFCRILLLILIVMYYMIILNDGLRIFMVIQTLVRGLIRGQCFVDWPHGMHWGMSVGLSTETSMRFYTIMRKLGGHPKSYSGMTTFWDTLSYCALWDFHVHGNIHTWIVDRHDINFIQGRLDRFCAN